jgi:hypothetical protein
MPVASVNANGLVGADVLPTAVVDLLTRADALRSLQLRL